MEEKHKAKKEEEEVIEAELPLPDIIHSDFDAG